MYSLPGDQTKLQLAQERAVEYMLRNTQSVENPVATFLVGQPGSGKSSIVGLIRTESGANPVVIDTDAIRAFHPRHDEIMKMDPAKIYQEFEPFTWGVFGKLMETAIAEKKNILFDGTFGGDFKMIRVEMEKMKEAGYSNELAALSVNDSFSKIGIAFRQEKQIELFGHGRHVPTEFHDMAYQNIPNNMQKAIDNKLVDKCHLYARDIENTTTVKKASFDVSNSKEFLEEFKKERGKTLSPEQVRVLESYQERTSTMMKKRGVHSEEIQKFNRYVDYSKKEIIPPKTKGMSM